MSRTGYVTCTHPQNPNTGISLIWAELIKELNM